MIGEKEKAQELFDKVLAGIRAQGGQSLSGGRCAYRGDNDRKCAAGHLLSDEDMRQYNIENTCASVNAQCFIPFFRERPELDPHKPLLSLMQSAHDTAGSVLDGNGTPDGDRLRDEQFMMRFEEKMAAIATERDLVYTAAA